MYELARRAVVSKHWNWRLFRGALTEMHLRIEERMWQRDWDDLERGEWGGPNLADPATLGCLLHLIRSVYGDPKACAEVNGVSNPGDSDHWVVRAWSRKDGCFIRGCGATEVEALVVALESADEFG